MSNTKHINALIFDVGDILFDATVWRRWLTTELIGRGKAVTYPQLVESWEQLLVEVYKGRADYWDRFAELMTRFELEPSQAKEVELLAREKGQAVQENREPMPQVPETLNRLDQRGIKLVALSDTESGEAGVRKILSQLGIEHCFHAVVSSFAIGHAKPEPEAFDHAILATGHPKRECGFVAHDVDELEGAQQHGLLAIGYNYQPDAPADVYIEDFCELLDLVA